MNDMQGTDFQKLVWNEVLTIPFGEVRSYKQIAQAIDRPLSYRAVANACASNPYAPEVPCHRVICDNGSIGGYSGDGGIARKIELLETESKARLEVNYEDCK
ncbi:MAG: hypothetical protein CL995_05300 [Euryarchaeota archaeon]|nr:hypothetical protein [Euryarchaeota archaeon]